MPRIAALLLLAVSAEANPADRARTAASLLDLLAAEEGTSTGLSDAGAEQRERLAIAEQLLAELDAVLPPPQLDLARQLQVIAAAGGPAERIVQVARRLQAALQRRFSLDFVPERAPDLARGASLYAQSCAACHGAEGRPSAGARLSLSTPPTALADAAATRSFTPRHVFHVLTAGVAETAMPSFADALDEQARWDLAFHVATLPQRARRDDVQLDRARAAGFFAGPRQLAAVTDDFLRLQFRAAGLSSEQVEQALSAVRRGPFAESHDGLPPVVLPRVPGGLRLLWQETEDEAGTPVERMGLVAGGSSQATGDQALDAIRVIARQLLSRRGSPPFDLNVVLFGSAEDARNRMRALAGCNLVSDEEIECDAAPPAAR